MLMAGLIKHVSTEKLYERIASAGNMTTTDALYEMRGLHTSPLVKIHCELEPSPKERTSTVARRVNIRASL